MPVFTPETAAEAGRSGGRAKAANLAATKARYLDALPDHWQTPEEAKRFLESVGMMAARGLLPGSAASAAARAVEIWHKVEALRLDREHLADLERQLDDVRARRGAA